MANGGTSQHIKAHAGLQLPQYHKYLLCFSKSRLASSPFSFPPLRKLPLAHRLPSPSHLLLYRKLPLARRLPSLQFLTLLITQLFSVFSALVSLTLLSISCYCAVSTILSCSPASLAPGVSGLLVMFSLRLSLSVLDSSRCLWIFDLS